VRAGFGSRTCTPFGNMRMHSSGGRERKIPFLGIILLRGASARTEVTAFGKMPRMFVLYHLRRKRRSIENQFDVALNLALDTTQPDFEKIDELTTQFQKRLDQVDLNIEVVRTAQLITRAQAFDLQVPPGSDPDMWNLVSARRVLTPNPLYS